MPTFNQLDEKHKYHLACAIIRNSKDGHIWRTNYHNGHALKLYLEKLDLDIGCFSRHYNLRFTINKKEHEQKNQTAV